MRNFFPIRHQVRIVAVGTSRAQCGIDPRFFSVKDNGTHPQAYNLSVGGSALPCADLILKEYVERCPQVKWVVYGRRQSYLQPTLYRSKRWDTHG